VTALERYVRHAERFGVELVFETAAGLGKPEAELTVAELVDLARRMKAIDAKVDPAKPDKLVALAGAGVEAAYRERLSVVLDHIAPRRCVACGKPLAADSEERVCSSSLCRTVLLRVEGTIAGRCCEWCGRAIVGRTDRRTCSKTCRQRLARSGGRGPFSSAVGVTSDCGAGCRSDSADNGRFVTPTAYEQRGSEAENRGGRDFREVSPDVGEQMGLWA
jgi:predicted nucleic acid-binding Zn ribbon protein